MTVQSRLGQATLLRRLGVQNQGRNLPIAETVQPVMIMSSVAPVTGDPYEARGLVGRTIVPVAGRLTGMELQSNAAGGLLVEIMQLNTNAADSVQLTIHTVPQIRDVAGAIEIPILNVGGVAIQSRAFAGNPLVLSSPPIPSTFIPGNIVDRQVEFGPMLIPPGSFAAIIGVGVNVQLEGLFLFHEIPDQA